MSAFLPFIVFAVLALAAVAFAAVPLWRKTSGKTRVALLAAAALSLLATGLGAYAVLGRPQLALREAQGLDARDMRALVPILIKKMRENPNDPMGWRYLAQAYMAVERPAYAAKALAKEISIRGKGDAALNAGYGETLLQANEGRMTPEAEEAFNDALKVDPHSRPARFYLGMAKAMRNDRAGAIALWQSLLDDTPTSSRLHQLLVDRIAMLTAQSVSQRPGAAGAPDPRQMVAMLAARLKADPNDALAWVRLMRAYTVLGETEKAKQALADARKAFPDNQDAQTAFATAAKALKIQ